MKVALVSAEGHCHISHQQNVRTGGTLWFIASLIRSPRAKIYLTRRRMVWQPPSTGTCLSCPASNTRPLLLPCSLPVMEGLRPIQMETCANWSLKRYNYSSGAAAAEDWITNHPSAAAVTTPASGEELRRPQRRRRVRALHTARIIQGTNGTLKPVCIVTFNLHPSLRVRAGSHPTFK